MRIFWKDWGIKIGVYGTQGKWIKKNHQRLYLSGQLRKGEGPKFRSNPNDFSVILPNLNYVKNTSLENSSSQTVSDNLNRSIMELMRKNEKISTEKMAMELGVSIRTIKRRIAQMDQVHYIGRGINGYWKIDPEVDNNNER